MSTGRAGRAVTVAGSDWLLASSMAYSENVYVRPLTRPPMTQEVVVTGRLSQPAAVGSAGLSAIR